MSKYQRYIESVISGKSIECNYVKAAVSRHIEDLKRDDIYFDQQSADRAIKFIELLKHTKGESAHAKFELTDWQAFIIASIFGWKNSETGMRRFKYAYIEIARKNGKTTFAGAISLYMLLMDGEQGAEVYTAATKRDQAKICFLEAQAMVRKLKKDSPAIDKLVGVHQHNIHVISTNSKLEALSADSDKLDGLGPHCSIIDEYHAHKNDDLYNVLKSGMGARKQPLQFVITTAGFDKALPCYRLRETVIKILKNKVQDDTQFGIIFTIDDNDDWQDPKNWKKSNPNLGISISEKFLIDEYKQAIINGASQEVNFKTKNLNIWTDAAQVWINEETWKANTHGIEEKELEGKMCYGGLDLASGIDFNAFVLLFPNVRSGIHAIKLWLWKPENKIFDNKEKKDYREWVRQGFIETTPGDVIEWGFISEKIKSLTGVYDIRSISYDPYRANHGVIQDLIAYGMQCHDLAQIMSRLAEPTNQLEKMATSKQFEHFKNPCLNWMMAQAEIIRDSKGNIMVTKADQLKKVDGVSALVNAIAEWMTFESQSQDDFFLMVNLK